MTAGGWITMVASVGFVTGLFVWCVVRVLAHKGPSHPLAHVEPIAEREVEER